MRDVLPSRAFRVMGVYLLCAVPAWIARQLTHHEYGWTSPLIFQGVMLLATVILLRLDGIDYQQSGLSRPFGWGWLGYLPLAVVLDLLTTLALIRTHSYFPAVSDHMSTVAALFWTGLYVPFAEEWFLRGWFQTSLARALDASTSRLVVLFSATVFALLHLGWYLRGRSGAGTLVIVVATFFLGLMCSRTRQQTGSVFPAFVIHVVFNVSGILTSCGLNFVLTHPKL